MKFIVYSQFGELLDVAISLSKKHETLFYVPTEEYKNIGIGLVDHIENWFDYIGKGYTWIIDSCNFGRLQDWLREQDEAVFGGSELGDELENQRQINQKWFKDLGFKQPKSKNFKNIDDAILFVKSNLDTRWILKQNGDAPKSLNHMGKFEDNSDMLFHLEELKKHWNEIELGPIDFDLMEVVKGLEVAASAFFNGSNFLRDNKGKICGFLNFEEKKEADGNTGETCGEMGTTFYGCNTDNVLFNSIMGKPELIDKLIGIDFRGIFDINCIKTDKGIVALEPTCRPGIPSSSYEFIKGLSNFEEVADACARGHQIVPQIHFNWGMVMCIVAKPFPIESDVDSDATSIGEKLWLLKKEGIPTDKISSHIGLYNFKKDETGYRVVTKNGYLLTVFDTGTSIGSIRKRLIDFIKNNLYISGMKYRTDIGKRVEDYEMTIKTDDKLEIPLYVKTDKPRIKNIFKPKLFINI